MIAAVQLSAVRIVTELIGECTVVLMSTLDVVCTSSLYGIVVVVVVVRLVEMILNLAGSFILGTAGLPFLPRAAPVNLRQ